MTQGYIQLGDSLDKDETKKVVDIRFVMCKNAHRN